MAQPLIFNPMFFVHLFAAGCFIHAILAFFSYILVKGDQIMKVVVQVKCEPNGPTIDQLASLFGRAMEGSDVEHDGKGSIFIHDYKELVGRIVQEAFDAGRQHERKHPCSETEK